MKRNKMYLFLTMLLMFMLVLTACSGNKSTSMQAMPAAARDMSAVQETAAYTEGAFEANSSDNAGIHEKNSSAPQALPAGRKLIRNMDLTVETDTFDQLLDTLSLHIKELGGYIEQSSISGNSLNYNNEPIPRYASLTVRIPSEKLNGFADIIAGSSNITNKSETTQDVTLQYSDLESKKKSLTIEQDRIWSLLEKADTLEAVIALEERLSEIRYQLESMESQLRLFDNQVDYSTVCLDINEILGAATFTPTEPERMGQRIQNGFLKNIASITRGLTSLFIWLITFSPFWVPVLVVVLVFLALHRRKVHNTMKTPVTQLEDHTDTPDIT